MSGQLAEFRKNIEEYVTSHKLLLNVVHLVYTSLLWQNIIGFAIIGGVTLLDYIFVTSTAWKTLPYIFILSLEVYLLEIVLWKFTPFLKPAPEDAKNSLTAVLDKAFSCAACSCGDGSEGCSCVNKLKEITFLKGFSQTPYFTPALTALSLLLLTLVSSIFSGSFLAFVFVFGSLLAPGIISHGFHTLAYQKGYVPFVQPQVDKFVKPQIEKVWGILTGNAPAPAPAPTTDAAPSEPVPDPITREAPAPASDNADGGFDVNGLLSSIGDLAQSLEKEN